MKFTQTQAVEALVSLGVAAAEIVENEADSTFNNDELLAAVDTTRSVILKPKHKAELKEELERSVGGMIGKALEKHLKKTTGFNAFTPEMTDDQKIQASLDFFVGNIEKNKGDAQEVINQLAATHAAEIEKLTRESGEKLTASEKRFIERDINEYFEDVVSKMPLLETANKKELAKLGKAFMESRFAIKYDEAGKKVGYYQKDNPEVPALNDAKNNPLNDAEELKGYFSTIGVYKTDMRNNNPADLLDKTKQANTPMLGNTANKRTTDGGDAWMKQVNEYAAAQTATSNAPKI